MAISTSANIFGSSPFTALQKHMRAAVDCADQVQPLFEALCDGDQARVEEVQRIIFEKEADELKNELRTHQFAGFECNSSCLLVAPIKTNNVIKTQCH